MGHAEKIVTSNPSDIEELEKFEEALGKMDLTEKLSVCQSLSEHFSEVNVYKIVLMYLGREEEIVNEIKRILSWTDAEPKARALIALLDVPDKDVQIAAIEILGAIGKPFVLPYLEEILDLKDVELCKTIVKTIKEIDNSESAVSVKKCFESEDPDLVVLAIETLSKWPPQVSWKAFKHLLNHPSPEVRAEAAFAIALRKDSSSASAMLNRIEVEDDNNARRTMLRHIGLIPSKNLIIPLLKIIVSDSDQKARLEASRSLDRIQGILGIYLLYSFINLSDQKVRAEVVFRIGKFGTNNEQHKKYLRKLIGAEKEKIVLEAAVQALGFIGDREDMPLLEGLIGGDIITSYNALLSLTRMWRLEDKFHAIKILNKNLSQMTMQIILKYLIRRSGMSIDPEPLLVCIKKIFSEYDNVNVRYLAILLLGHTPSVDVVEFIMDIYSSVKDEYEKEAIEKTMFLISKDHEDIILEYCGKCDHAHFSDMLMFISEDMSSEFYRDLTQIIFVRYDNVISDADHKDTKDRLFKVFISSPVAATNFITSLPDEKWKESFLRFVLQNADLDLITCISDVLSGLILDESSAVQMVAVELLMGVKNPSLVPKLIGVAEKSTSEHTQTMAKSIVKFYIEEGVI